MLPADTYDVACEILRPYRDASYAELAASIGKPALEDTFVRNGTEYRVGVRVLWAGNPPGAIRVEVTIYGPSTWRLERLTESFVVERPDDDE